MAQSQIDSTGAGRGNFKSYATGFILSIVLSIIAFGLVMNGALPRSAIVFGLLAAAIVQMMVHLHYFLHLDASSAARWNVLALIFTLLIMFIFVGGSIWIMFNLNDRMM
jgi:cytochrome o ubiquinol oxidase operon protein cyoD